MRIEVPNIGYRKGSPPNLSRFEEDITAWFLNQPSVGSQSWLLAHAEDGIIWGTIDDHHLLLSSDAFPTISPSLRTFTLWEARLFGEARR